MTDLTRPKAILFDWDNTLVDTWGVIQDALNTTFRTYGLPEWSLEETRTKVRHSMRDSFPAIFGDQWLAAGEVFYARYEEIHMDALTVKDGAVEALNLAQDQGLYLGVVSNKRGANLRKEADHLGWSPYFGQIVGAFDASADKPDPAHVLMALEPSGISPGPDVWFIGDADIDMQCAQNSDLTGILISDAMDLGPEFNDFKPHSVLPSCEGLCNLLRKL